MNKIKYTWAVVRCDIQHFPNHPQYTYTLVSSVKADHIVRRCKTAEEAYKTSTELNILAKIHES